MIQKTKDLPANTKEIALATDIINKLKERLKTQQNKKEIDDKTFITLYEETVQMVDYVGNLSLPAFEIRDDLEEYYIKEHPQSPKLAMKLFHDCIKTIHRDYNILKNRCFTILDELDNLYKKCNKKEPPNWNI